VFFVAHLARTDAHLLRVVGEDLLLLGDPLGGGLLGEGVILGTVLLQAQLMRLVHMSADTLEAE